MEDFWGEEGGEGLVGVGFDSCALLLSFRLCVLCGVLVLSLV